MLSGYKIKRELLRVLRQPKQWPNDFLSYVGGARYYDWVLAYKAQLRHGEQDVGEKVAVFLIFPSQGLKPSHLRSLRYLAEKQYKTILVSNLALSDADLEQALPLCERFIQRPNFGYDFGGYRDGVLAALNAAVAPKRLLLLNDSTWFPIIDGADWVGDIERLDLDFSAAASNFGVPRPDPAQFKTMSFDYRTDHKRFHYCSFALAFGPRVLKDPDFRRFWKRFPLTNKKKSTVRRGEVGLTAWALRKGYTHGATFDMASLEEALFELPEDRLREAARYLIVPEDERMKTVLLETLPMLDAMPKGQCVNLILTTIARQGVSYASAYFNIVERGFPFLKKSPIRLDPKARATTLAILDRLDGPAAIEARTEALEMAP